MKDCSGAAARECCLVRLFKPEQLSVGMRERLLLALKPGRLTVNDQGGEAWPGRAWQVFKKMEKKKGAELQSLLCLAAESQLAGLASFLFKKVGGGRGVPKLPSQLADSQLCEFS